MKAVSRNPAGRPAFPLDPRQHADVTHRPRSCHGGQNTRTREPTTADMSVTLHFENTRTHAHTHKARRTLSLTSRCKTERQPSFRSVLLTVGRILRSDGKCEQWQFDVHRLSARLQILRFRPQQPFGSNGNPQTHCRADYLFKLVGGAHT